MLQLLKRYRELFAIGALLIVPLVTYLAQAKHGRELNSFDRAVLFVTSPIERLVTWSVGGAVDSYQSWVALRHVRDENLELRRENLRLQEQLAGLSEAQAENQRLRNLLDFAQSAPGPVLVAPIIGEAPVMNRLTVTIGKGASDGVAKGMAVTSHQGVVGRVLSVATHRADVLLLQDSAFAVPVRVQRDSSRARAKVVGQGERDRPPLLTQALRGDDVQDGDLLITNGTDGVFPKGLVVGRAAKVVKPNFGMFLSAEVVPATDVRRLEEVLVLTGRPPDIEPEAALPRP